jgi:hypothetical protein
MQAIHILQKDVRHLWLELCLFMLVTALFGWRDYDWAEVLLGITGAFVIARLIHAEPLPGDTQFWITRPYDWKSLLTAKVLFILIFLNLPVLIARAVIIIYREGFPVSYALVPLVWSQFLIIVGFCLPVAALAAVTADLVPFIFSTLVLLVIASIVASGSIPFIGMLDGALQTAAWPEGVEWMRFAFVFVIVTLTAAGLLNIQYKARRTPFSRIAAAALLLIAVLGYVTIPPTLGADLQARLSAPPPFASQVRVEVDSMPRKFAPRGRRNMVQISVPLNVVGIPSDVVAHMDASSITLEAQDGRQTARALTIPSRNNGPSLRAFDDIVFISPSFFAAERKQPVKLRGALYITVFRAPRATHLTLTAEPQYVGDGLQCSVNAISGQLRCQSAFRWPRLLVDAKVRDEAESLWSLISYSPFPSGMELNYLEGHLASGPPPHDPQATILVMEPLAHFRTEFSADNFQLEQFAAPR